MTTLPSPLNLVTPRHGGWFELGDGTLVKGADEVERVHAEQQRRMRGEDETESAENVRTADRYRDGFIPSAEALGAKDRNEDDTCHPYGGWERDSGFLSYPEGSRRYEADITHAPR